MVVMNFWPAIGKIYINFANVGREFWPSAWKIHINFANSGRVFLAFRPQESRDDTLRIYNNFANVGRGYLPATPLTFDLSSSSISQWYKEELYQMRKEMMWLFDLLSPKTGGQYMEDLY